MSTLDIISPLVKNISLRKKLLLVVLTACNTALLLASMAVIIFDRQSAKSTLQQEISVLGSVIAQRSSAALTFYDKQLAEENLLALSEKDTVISACMYASSGELFAVYAGRQGRGECAQVAPRLESGFSGNVYLGRQDIMLDGYSVGSVYIVTSLDGINQRLVRSVVFVSIIFIMAGVVAFVLAIKLQNIITRPIDELAEASRKIHLNKSYSLRVNKVTNDEIGQLVTAFNDMLEGIEDRDAMLVDAKKNLEEIVKDRTAKLHDAQNELIRKDRMATLGQLTATVSHELRNPLGTIRTSVFTLSNRINKDEAIQRVMDRIDRNIVRCDSIITELLDYSRIRALQHQKTKLSVWLMDLLSEIKVPDDISVSLDLDDSIETEVDRDLFRRVMINVIDNASQAISSAEANGQEKKIIIESRINNGVIEVIVTDTGPGIDKDVLPKIFEPLFSTRSFGIGLGLSIVKQIMVQHGGNVEITSEPNIGTRVVLVLPAVLISAPFIEQHTA